MIGNRSYMRNITPGAQSMSMVGWILLITTITYVVENALILWFKNEAIIEFFGLSAIALKSGWVWTLITYALLHDPVAAGGIWHILFNLLLIFFTGKVLENDIGSKNLLTLYMTSALWGGLVWALVHWQGHSVLIGASAGGIGLLTVFCLLHKEEPMTFLLFFIIPITMKPKWLLTGIIGIELLGFLFSELPSKAGNYAIANSAHLGGILGGFIFYSIIRQGDPSAWLHQILKKTPFSKKPSPSALSYKVDLQNRHHLKSEVDRILDKINHKGFGSLTPQEKAILDKARDLL